MNQQDQFQKIALWRYSLIAPAVAGTFEAASIAEYFRNIASRSHLSPGGKLVSLSAYTLERWYYHYKHSGLEGITPKVRIDSGKPRALSDSAIEQIYIIKEQFPYITGKKIYQKLIESGHIDASKTSLATIHRYIRNNGLKKPLPGDNMIKTYEMEFANDCWQADTSNGPKIKVSGKCCQTYLINFIDDASRMLMHFQFYFNDNAVNMQDSFKQAIAKFGIPKMLYVDNGKPYDNRQLQLICASLGIVLTHTRPFDGRAKGKVERSFKTIKNNWMHCTDWNTFSSLKDIDDSLAKSVANEYTHQKHTSLQCSPKERFMQDINKVRYIPIEELDFYFLHREIRRVTNAATVKIFGQEYETPQKYIGSKIQIRYLPTDLSKLFIFSDENKLVHTIFPVNKIENAKIKRSYIDYSKGGLY